MSRVKGEPLRVDHQIVEITRPDKVLFPDGGITKRGIAEYYQRIAPVMRPHLLRRPIAMERCPDGINAQGDPWKDLKQHA